LLLIHNLSGGGAELVAETLFSRLDRSRFRVSLCELSGHGERARTLIELGYNDVYSLNPSERRLPPPSRLLRLRRLISELDVDIVHSHSTDALADAVGLTMRRIRLVHTFHFGNYPHHAPTHLRLERLFHRRANQLVAVGYSQARAIADAYGINADRIRVVLNGVDPRPPCIDNELLKPYLGAGRVLVGTIGTLIPQKGHFDLLTVAAEVKKQGLPVTFLIVGGGPLQKELEARALEMKVEDVVVFLGWIKDAAMRVLPALDVFFQPSRWEAMSMVLLEAAAAGKAILCTDVGEARRVISDGQTGLVVAPGDQRAMVRLLSALVEQPDLRHRLGAKAKETVLSQFTSARMVLSYSSLYDEVVQRHPT
jgi:glycosyltransferase involved in cell wall biosynthesis